MSRQPNSERDDQDESGDRLRKRSFLFLKVADGSCAREFALSRYSAPAAGLNLSQAIFSVLRESSVKLVVRKESRAHSKSKHVDEKTMS